MKKQNYLQTCIVRFRSKYLYQRSSILAHNEYSKRGNIFAKLLGINDHVNNTWKRTEAWDEWK